MSGLVEERGRRWEEQCGRKSVGKMELRWRVWRRTQLKAGAGRDWDRKGLGCGWGWGGVWAWLWVGWSHQRQGVADKDGAVGPGNPRRVGLSSFMAEARLCPFESLP